jgi:transcription initiation factor IIE alpha subunit
MMLCNYRLTFARLNHLPDQRPVYVCPHCKTRIPFGTKNNPPPSKCPGCWYQLYIPTELERDSVIQLTCPTCTANFTIVLLWDGQPRDRFTCPKCGSVVSPPLVFSDRDKRKHYLWVVVGMVGFWLVVLGILGLIVLLR